MRVRVLVSAASLIFVVLSAHAGGGSAVGLAPRVNEPVIGTFVGADVSLTGDHLGLPTSARSIQFDFDGRISTITPSSPLVRSWLDTGIQFSLPIDVHSGSLTVIVDGQPSNVVDMFVYQISTRALPPSPGTSAHALALAVAPDHRVWVNEEFHSQLKGLPADPAQPLTVRTIPQVSGSGIFATNISGQDAQARQSILGEDIDAQPDGSIWFTEGGAYLYSGQRYNTSRIVRYDPAADTFACYNLPVDSAEVIGVLIDNARGTVWYAEGSLTRGNAISGFSLADATPDCAWNPATGVRAPICATVPIPGCHRRFVLPNAHSAPASLVLDPSGNIWFTEFWGNRIGRLNPDTGLLTELPLPASIARQGPGAFVGSGPFELEFDSLGNLWMTEAFDATLDRVRPDRMSPANFNCTQLDITGRNPCVDEIFVGSNGFDGKTMHTVTVGPDGLVWFSYGSQSGLVVFAGVTTSSPDARLGFVDTNKNNFVVVLPQLPGVVDVGGVAADAGTRDIWFAEYTANTIGRLQPASGDGDGIPDAVDNCPTVYNPGQENHDGSVNLSAYGKSFNDVTWINSDTMGDACDADIDNDGLTNAVEASIGPGEANHALCPSASADTDPLKGDTDGDGVLDGAECALGSNPNDPNSKPAPPAPADDPDRDGLSTAFEITIGTDPNVRDTDGDGLSDGIEYKYYNSNPLSADTDGDGIPDAKEVASINGDTVVNVLDLAQDASVLGTARGDSRYIPDFDTNKDGYINVLDLQFIASHLN